MSHLIQKHQQKNNKGRGILFSPEQIALFESRLNPARSQSDTVTESTRQVRERTNNKKRTYATKEAIRKDNKQSNSKKIGNRVTIASTTNPEDVRTKRILSPKNTTQVEQRIENPERRVNNQQLEAYWENKLLQDKFNTEVLPAAGSFMEKFMPSTLVGALTDKNRSFVGSMVEGNKGLGEIDESAGAGTNLLFDVTSPGAWSKGLKLLQTPTARKAINYMTTVRLPKTSADYMRLGPIELKFPQGRLNVGVPMPESVRFARDNISVSDIRDFIRQRLSRNYGASTQQIDRRITLNARDRGLSEDEYLNLLGDQMSEPRHPVHRGFMNFLQNRPVIDEPPRILRTRTPEEVKQFGRYTPKEVIDPVTGELKDNVSFDGVITGAHGNFINDTSSPEEVAYKLSMLRRHPEIGRREVFDIMADNKSGQSGIIVHTHDRDLSVDSSVLANAMQKRLGETAIRLPNRNGTVYLNDLGYNNLFSNKIYEDQSLIDAMENGQVYVNNWYREDDPLFNFVRFSDGTIVAKNRKGHIVGVYPAREEKEVLNTINNSIESVNKKFKLDYAPATTSESVPSKMWTFKKGILVPDQYHVLLKNGGNIFKKRNRLIKK